MAKAQTIDENEKHVSDLVGKKVDAQSSFSKAPSKDQVGFFTGLKSKPSTNTFYPRAAALSFDKRRSEASSGCSNASPTLRKNKHLQLPEQAELQRLLEEEKDERYRYLLKHGIVHAIEIETKTIYVELPQIAGILIVYRRPGVRELNPNVINLEGRDLMHIPLLEGEEQVKTINLEDNMIKQMENLVSLPSLTSINLKGN